MHVLELVCCFLAGALFAWTVAKAKGAAAIARSRAAMREEIRRWQDETAMARARESQLAQEIATWSKGLQQGREDVIAIMPLLLAAHARLSQPTAPQQIHTGIDA